MADLDDRDTSLNGWGGSGFGSGGVGAGSSASFGGGGFGGGWSGGFGSSPNPGSGGGYSGGFSQSQFGGGGAPQTGSGGGGLLGGSYGLPRQNPFSDKSRFTFGGALTSSIGRKMLSGVDTSLLSRLVGLQTAYGKPLNISSGYRSPALNKKIGGAKSSQHILGNAIDIKLPEKTIEETNRFVGLASEFGFGGLGVYKPGSVHLDTANIRAWGPDYTKASIPGWAGASLAKHMAGGYGVAPQGMGQAPSVAMVGAPPTATASLGQGIGPPAGAQATGSPVYSGATPGSGTAPGSSVMASAAPTYSDAQTGSWLGNLLGKAASGAQAYGAQYVERAKSPENVAKFARQNPMGAMQLASAFSKGGAGAGAQPSGEGGKGYTSAQNDQFKSKLAEYVKKKTAKPQDKSKGKKKPFIFKTPETKFPRYTQSYWLKNLRFS